MGVRGLHAKPVVLVVEDEDGVRNLVVDALRIAGHPTREAHDGIEAGLALQDENVGLVILDVNLPNRDGLETLKRLRATGSRTPVIMLSARTEREDVAAGFELGADDYVRKPFGVRELTLRVEAVLRRSSATDPTQKPTTKLVCGPIELDIDNHKALAFGAYIELSPTEYRLMEYLMHNQHRVVTKQELLRNVWGIDFRSKSAVLETYISYLRKKTHLNGWTGIKTVRGVGYQVAP